MEKSPLEPWESQTGSAHTPPPPNNIADTFCRCRRSPSVRGHVLSGKGKVRAGLWQSPRV